MDVLRPLGQKKMRPAGHFENLARSRVDLPGDKEGNQLLRNFPEIEIAAHQVIFVTPVRVPHRIGVVLKDINLADQPFLAQPPLRHRETRLQEAFSRFVVHHQIPQPITFRSGVFRVTSGVLIEPRAV